MLLSAEVKVNAKFGAASITGRDGRRIGGVLLTAGRRLLGRARRPPGSLPMTDTLYRDDAYLAEAEAVVPAAGPDGVELDRSIFYARSGGQPGDTGRLGGVWR